MRGGGDALSNIKNKPTEPLLLRCGRGKSKIHPGPSMFIVSDKTRTGKSAWTSVDGQTTPSPQKRIGPLWKLNRTVKYLTLGGMGEWDT